MGSRVSGTADGAQAWTWVERRARYRRVADRLAALDDSDIAELIGRAVPGGKGIGGTTASVNVDGVPVFVKSVPVTDLERRAEHAGSTANLFRLPLFYQYGVGSTGFGVWRELAVHAITTRWVLDDHFPGFPVLYHWRMLPRTPAADDPVELARGVAQWDGSPAVRARLEAISRSRVNAVLFMEHIPYTVDGWLTDA